MSPGAGVGLRAEHHAAMLAERPPLALLEVHAENYLADGPAQAALERLRGDYAVSVHSVSLSITAADGPDPALLQAIAGLVGRIEPALVSVHAAWVGAAGESFCGLYPYPRTIQALEVAVCNVEIIQTALGRPVLVENLAPLMDWQVSTMDEPAFLAALAKRTGCGLLLDIANIEVAAANLGQHAEALLAAFATANVGQYHLAGGREVDGELGRLRIDSHDGPVAQSTWSLYAQALERIGPRPTVVEWDDRLPSLAGLVAEARRAETLIAEAKRHVA